MKVVITGPESTGKTTLTRALSTHYKTPFIPEFARLYLEGKDATYNYADLLIMAQGQQEMIDEAGSSQLIICDTDLLTYQIWSQFKYGKCDPWIVKGLANSEIDLYLLCDVDIPWEPDPLRENPADRKVLFNIYESELQILNVSYKIISGKAEERFSTAVKEIDSLIPR